MATGVVLNGDLTLGTVRKGDSAVGAEGMARGGRVEAHVHAVALAVGEHSAPTGAGQLDEARVLTADDNRAILAHEAHERAAVSYTHLDVYKRQFLRREPPLGGHARAQGGLPVPSRPRHRFRSPPPLDARDRAHAFVT